MGTVKSIKGITIEIAGDTKKLGQALKGVNEQSQDLGASLRYVDQLLKFDPGNTELLTEKQSILTDSVANTCEKLEKLKSVQNQIKQQYASGEIGQRAYLDFQAELAKTERKLKELETESFNVADALNRTGDEAHEAADELSDLDDSADDLADGFGSIDDVLGKLVKGGKIAAFVGAIAGAASAIGDIEADTREFREEMAKLDVAYATANLSVEAAETAYRNLYRVLGETDQSVEAAQQIALLADSTEDVVRWSALAPGLVARFGDALQPETFFESANETLKLGEATGAFVQLLEGTGVISVEAFDLALQSLNTAEEKQAYMQEVTESLLLDAAAAYEERNANVLAARDADARWESAMADVGETLAPLAQDVRNFGADVLEWFVPRLQDGMSALGDLGTAFSDVGAQLVEEWPQVIAWFDEKFSGFVDTLNSFNQGIRDFFSDTVDTSALAEEQLGQNLAAINTNIMTAEELMRSGAETFYDPWIGAGASFNETCQGFLESFNKTVSTIYNTDWRLPNPKVPTFSVSGKFSLETGAVPKINVLWNATGGILTGPTIFGALGGQLLGGGEAGQEAVLPLSGFYANLERILAEQQAPNYQTFVNIERFENRTDDDLDTLVDKLTPRINAAMTRQYLRKVGVRY